LREGSAVLFSEDAGGQRFASQVQTLLDSPAVVVPCVTSLDNFTSKAPAALLAANGLELDPSDTNLEKVAGLVLELLGLLRKRRRLFINKITFFSCVCVAKRDTDRARELLSDTNF
jgi:hypothetical protein